MAGKHRASAVQRQSPAHQSPSGPKRTAISAEHLLAVSPHYGERSAPSTLRDFGRHVGRIGVLAVALGVGGALTGGVGAAHGAPDTVANTSDASSSATDDTTTAGQDAQTTAATDGNGLTSIGATGTSGWDEPIDASSTFEDSTWEAELAADEAF
ncbi:MAG: hypothetical protein K0U78_12905, partial [Actinomycetia bacterium]|nr:hypothetical protein [Actinomycetes bacterium]